MPLRNYICKMKISFLTILSLFVIIKVSYAQAEQGEYEKCLLSYNEVSNQGVEQDITAFGWFTELPYVPSYTYYDRDAKRKITIKTKINPYQNESLGNVKDMTIFGGDYGQILCKCKNNDQELLLLDLNVLHPDFIGASLAVEIKHNPETETYIFASYPFEDEFPYKYEEDVVYTKFSISYLEQFCSN